MDNVRKFFVICLLTIFIKVRWAFLHMHPSCIKFSVGDYEEKRVEFYFQNIKTGRVHYNYTINKE